MERSTMVVLVMMGLMMMAMGLSPMNSLPPILSRSRRPPRKQHARMARWLISQASWGTLSTTSLHLNGTAFGNIASFSDGPSHNSTGVPYFYLTEMDFTLQDVKADPRCSLTVTEASLKYGHCRGIDVEDPVCVRVVLSGKLAKVGDEEVTFAEDALFHKHPEMRWWPKAHNFSTYKLAVENIFLLDFFGPPAQPSVEEYFAAAAAAATSVDELGAVEEQ
ncbi:hypothetical protein CBR_g36833 [Chara braunii]|uniref:CREG-like beta-barrel domain-containing protein n=1 Tax=Chara braunii TaxID=69332 RepID=A0A388LLM8_CHABU|nr:hypothetical protein CBR_g36833 [Chara braunii]|eukprot:GBG83219.1 hypothetical protein CBR_g36833 [Chara braunii]